MVIPACQRRDFLFYDLVLDNKNVYGRQVLFFYRGAQVGTHCHAARVDLMKLFADFDVEQIGNSVFVKLKRCITREKCSLFLHVVCCL